MRTSDTAGVLLEAIVWWVWPARRLVEILEDHGTPSITEAEGFPRRARAAV